MPSVEEDKALLARKLRELAAGNCALADVERIAFAIRDRWSIATAAELPPATDAEGALWAAVWDITSSCRESLVAAEGSLHPVLQHIAFLEGTSALPREWKASRP